jgi:site-specific recombinase XerD
MVRCITALITIRKHLEKPFRNATKDDMRSILKWMEQKGYKASTNEKFRQVLKLFYKVVYGNNEYYPEQVKWFSSKIGKEKTGKDTIMDMAEYLEEEEILKLIESAPILRSNVNQSIILYCECNKAIINGSAGNGWSLGLIAAAYL